MSPNAIAIINDLPGNSAEPIVIINIVKALKALAADGAGEVVTAPLIPAPGATQDATEQAATLKQQASPKAVGGLVYIDAIGAHLPAVPTARMGADKVNLLASLDGGVTYTSMFSNVTLAASQAEAVPTQAFVPGT